MGKKPLASRMRLSVHASGPYHDYLEKDWENYDEWHGKPRANPVDTRLYFHNDARSADRSGDRCGMDWPHSRLDVGKAAESVVELV